PSLEGLGLTRLPRAGWTVVYLSVHSAASSLTHLVGGDGRGLLCAPACKYRGGATLTAPTFSPSCEDVELKQLLQRWASRFTPCKATQGRIVRQALWIAATDPDFLQQADSNRELLELLHRVALEELSIPQQSPPPGS